MLLNFNRFKVRLGHTTVRALPGFWHVGPSGTRGNAVFRSTGGFVVNKTANNADRSFHSVFDKI